MSHSDTSISANAIGVVIPVYNRPRLILDALDSVSRQTIKPSKIVVVDDGSEDDTRESVGKWVANHPEINVELLAQDHAGVSNARNGGIARLADFPFLAIPDSDDLWPDDFLERSLDKLNACPEAVAVSSDRLYQSGESSRLNSLAELSADPVLWMIRNGGALISCTLFRTRTLLDAGPFPLHLRSGEDSYVFMRLARLGNWLHLPGNPVIFRPGGSGVGEEQQLSRKFHDARLRWAENYDEFVRQFPAKTPALQMQWQKAMGHRWKITGHHYRKQGFLETAVHCYRRSYETDPTTMAFLRLARAHIARLLGFGDSAKAPPD